MAAHIVHVLNPVSTRKTVDVGFRIRPLYLLDGHPNRDGRCYGRRCKEPKSGLKGAGKILERPQTEGQQKSTDAARSPYDA
jgi:hypothetical protein